MNQYFNTLYVSEPESYLAKDHETVVVKTAGEVKLQVPIHHLIGIVCLGSSIGLSPELIRYCCEHKLHISFISDTGRFQGRVEGSRPSNVLLRREQYRQADKREKCLEHARSFLLGKVANARTLLGRFKREKPTLSSQDALEEALNRLKQNLKHLKQAEDIDSLRGYEGEAAGIYFSCFAFGIKNEEFSFTGRVRRPPKDPINALLSFLYTILHHDCSGALAAVGLDPQVGFLHTDRPARPSLALDLMEEFRCIFVDRLVLKLINLRQISKDDFTDDLAGGLRMKDSTRKLVLIEYQNSKRELITHPILKREIAFALLPHVQARLLAKTIRGELTVYPPFLLR